MEKINVLFSIYENLETEILKEWCYQLECLEYNFPGEMILVLKVLPLKRIWVQILQNLSSSMLGQEAFKNFFLFSFLSTVANLLWLAYSKQVV